MASSTRPVGIHLRRIEAALIAQGNKRVRDLAPPLPADAVAVRLADLRLRAPSEVCEFYGWHDGYGTAETTHDWNMTPNGAYPLGLEHAIRSYLDGPGDTSVPEVAAPSWFPVFSLGSGLLVVRCDGPDDQPAEARRWDTWPGDFVTLSSLAEPLGWWADWLESQTWRWTPNGWIYALDVTQLPATQLESGLI